MDGHDPLTDVLRKVETAHGLPNAHYIDPEMFERERRHVLFANWSGVGFGKDVPEPGCVKPVEFLGMPLLIVRDDAGEVAVFQNTCRHRGMILVEEATKLRGAIRCPYHSWCYGLNGKLRTTPHVGGPGQSRHEAIKNDELGLIRIKSHMWLDVVFVNIDGMAAPFEEMNADLLARWAEFDQPIHFGGDESGYELTVKTNWKLAVENYCESYHLPWVHPGLNSYSRLEDHYNINELGKYSGQGSYLYRRYEEDGRHFPDFADLSEKWDTGAEYLVVYPNVLLGVQRDHLFAMVLEPKSLDETVEHVAIYYAKPERQMADWKAMKASNSQLWRGIFEEDIFVVEGMQKGRRGVHFDGGRFSPEMDGPTHNFHHWVASQLTG